MRQRSRRTVKHTIDSATRLRLLVGKFTPADYKKYTRSNHWKAKKAEAWAFWTELLGGRVCIMCGRPASQMHHKPSGYKALFREDVKQMLVPVCMSCHRRQHRKG